MSPLLIIAVKAVAGGTLVSAFAALGEFLRPRGLAGILGAAPSVALASLIVTSLATGAGSAASQATAMIAGAEALAVYCLVAIESVKRFGAVKGAITATGAWLAVAIGLWAVVLR
ncbi:MAG: hypothetical protein M3082_06775 [Candidatus Dormibacteraeota bacterium]|nr:hypothetical protein [Candidatus Dormibacteraeota bacterium]